MAFCKSCGKVIPDGKTICNRCRSEQMRNNASSEHRATNATATNATATNATAKNGTAGNTASKLNDINETNTFAKIGEELNEPKRNPSMQHYVKYNGIESKAKDVKTGISSKGDNPARNNSEDNSKTTMFVSTNGLTEEQKKIAEHNLQRENAPAPEEEAKFKKHFNGLLASNIFLAACILFTLFCFFSLADSLARVNPFAFIIVIFNTVICVNLWILFAKARQSKEIAPSYLKNIRQFANSRFILFIVIGCFAVLIAAAVTVLLKLDIFNDELIMQFLSPLVFKEFSEELVSAGELTLTAEIRSALYIYIPIIILTSFYYAYLIKFIHALFVNVTEKKIVLDYSIHACVCFGFAILGSVFSFILENSVTNAIKGVLPQIYSALSSLPVPFLGSSVNYAVPKLIFAILSSGIFGACALAYRFTFVDKSKKTPIIKI